MVSSSFGYLRRGAWSDEEDDLLRKCVEKYGEGKWHLVPLRAGLNRCRKSCRLRWLNYLRPDIKRGEFSTDEVDLIIRLHKLLGNRWSLIAGRLPGRTANDVKNHWNTHLHKKFVQATPTPATPAAPTQPHEEEGQGRVLKPRPRTFSNNNMVKSTQGNNRAPEIAPPSTAAALPPDDDGSNLQWWMSLLFDEDETNATWQPLTKGSPVAWTDGDARDCNSADGVAGGWNSFSTDEMDLWEPITSL